VTFIRSANPIWYLPDLIGQPLNDEYYAFFLTNTIPYIPQIVATTPNGTPVWAGYKVQFQPGGTLPNNLYFDPSLVYRIEVRHGPTQADALIYEVNDFVPDASQSINNNLGLFPEGNQASNGRFSIVNFTSPHTITTAGTYNVAPGWELVLTGVGSTTLTQNIYSEVDTANSPNAVTYSLQIENSGWTKAELNQVFKNNGNIWSGGAVTMSLTARAVGSPEDISLNYIQSDGGFFKTVANASAISTGLFQVVEGVANVDTTPQNSDLSNVATVTMQILLPTTGTVEVTNFQVMGQSQPFTTPSLAPIPPYQQESEERNVDHLFNVYAQDLLTKPKKSLLTGWNFSLNPFQFNPTALTTAATQVMYITDQTIIYQSAASRFDTGQSDIGNRLALEIFTRTGATSRVAIFQYIDPSIIRPYWSYVLSSMVRAKIFSPTNNQVRLKMRLIYSSALPDPISPTEPIASWAPNSDPVFSANWTAIVPNMDPEYILENGLGSSDLTYPGYAFEQFQLPDDDNADMTLGIVLYTMDDFISSAGDEDSLVIDQISLIPSEFAADALPQTFNECLADCQFYYEKSYSQGIMPGTNPSNFGFRYSSATAYPSGLNMDIYTESFNIVFNTIKRGDPVMTLYSPTNASPNTLTIQSAYNGAITGTTDIQVTGGGGFYLETNLSPKSVIYQPAEAAIKLSPGNVGGTEGRTIYHFTADSRMGI